MLTVQKREKADFHYLQWSPPLPLTQSQSTRSWGICMQYQELQRENLKITLWLDFCLGSAPSWLWPWANYVSRLSPRFLMSKTGGLEQMTLKSLPRPMILGFRDNRCVLSASSDSSYLFFLTKMAGVGEPYYLYWLGRKLTVKIHLS